MDNLTQRLAQVRERITAAEQRYGRKPGSVHLLAVSKTRPAQDIEAALRAGQQCFGESYVQEALTKMELLRGRPIQWHFIGPIQSNKTKSIAAGFDWVHSLDREGIAKRLSEQRPPAMGPLNVCLQVNISGEASKSGVQPEEVPALAHRIMVLPRLAVRGLMCIPAPDPDIERQRLAFRRLHRIFKDLIERGLPLDTLSMGMSDDLEAAIAEGSTLVRVGSAIFGQRARRSGLSLTTRIL